jgi:hypothetical protein
LGGIRDSGRLGESLPASHTAGMTKDEWENHHRLHYGGLTDKELQDELAYCEAEIRESNNLRLKMREMGVMTDVSTEDEMDRVQRFHRRADEFAGWKAKFELRVKVLKELLASRKVSSKQGGLDG